MTHELAASRLIARFQCCIDKLVHLRGLLPRFLLRLTQPVFTEQQIYSISAGYQWLDDAITLIKETIVHNYLKIHYLNKWLRLI